MLLCGIFFDLSVDACEGHLYIEDEEYPLREVLKQEFIIKDKHEKDYCQEVKEIVVAACRDYTHEDHVRYGREYSMLSEGRIEEERH